MVDKGISDDVVVRCKLLQGEGALFGRAAGFGSHEDGTFWIKLGRKFGRAQW